MTFEGVKLRAWKKSKFEIRLCASVKGVKRLIAKTIEHGQLRCDLPGVLDEEARLPGAIVGRREVHLALLTAESTGQSGCDTVVALLRRTWLNG